MSNEEDMTDLFKGRIAVLEAEIDELSGAAKVDIEVMKAEMKEKIAKMEAELEGRLEKRKERLAYYSKLVGNK
jgi:LPS O-antigen subunit length determinant protein (WzzB/FepE family)